MRQFMANIYWNIMLLTCTLFLLIGLSLGIGRSLALTLLGEGRGTIGSNSTSAFSDIISFFSRAIGLGALATGCNGTMPSIQSSVILSGTLGTL